MPIYDFQDEQTGELVEISMPMSQAVPIGETIEHEGRRVTRLVSGGAAIQDRTFEAFKTHQLPRNHPDAPRVDKDGRAVFHSRREVDDFCAKSRHTNNGDTIYHWDR